MLLWSFLDSPSQDGRFSAPGSDRVPGIQAGGCEKRSADFYFRFFDQDRAAGAGDLTDLGESHYGVYFISLWQDRAVADWGIFTAGLNGISGKPGI